MKLKVIIDQAHLCGLTTKRETRIEHGKPLSIEYFCGKFDFVKISLFSTFHMR